MNKIKLSGFMTSILAAVLLSAACDTDPIYYSESVPATFFETQENVYQRFLGPFESWADANFRDEYKYVLQEITTDEVCVADWGNNWWVNGVYERLQAHKFSPTDSFVEDVYGDLCKVFGYAFSSLNDLQYVDEEKLGFPKGTRDDLMTQMKVLVAQTYKEGLDLFGGWPIYTLTDMDAKPRSTDVETFKYIEGLLKEGIDKIAPKTELGGLETSLMHKAYPAFLLAQLYLNAVPFTRDDPSFAGDGMKYYEKCAEICEDIIAGKYGTYALEQDWTKIFDWDNKYSKEVIYTIPSAGNQRDYSRGVFGNWNINALEYYMGKKAPSAYNGYRLGPSLHPDGTPYTDAEMKLGRVFSKFEDSDCRKHNYTYTGNGHFHGAFFCGWTVNKSPLVPANEAWDQELAYTWLTKLRPEPGEAPWPADKCNNYATKGPRQWARMNIDVENGTGIWPSYIVDAIAPFSFPEIVEQYGLDPDHDTQYYRDHTGQAYNKYAEKIDMSKWSKLPSNCRYGDNECGIRLVKMYVIPWGTEYSDKSTRYLQSVVMGRLSQVYYMLAECYWRGAKGHNGGSKEKACQLINTVRARYFENGKDPNPVTTANLDEYRFLDELLVEFTGEQQRRTDLIRFGKFTTEKWWDHEPSVDIYKTRFPIPQIQISANNLLVQNPGYSSVVVE